MKKKNLIAALKKLVLSFGGEAKSNNAVDLVDEFADVAAQGDSGSTGVFQVHYSVSQPDNTVTVTESISDIVAAIKAGKRVEAVNLDNIDKGITQLLPLVYYLIEPDSTASLLFSWAEYNVVSREIVVDAFEQLKYDGHNWYYLAV